ncbi:MAG TPA: cobalamin-binding protein [Thermoplasmata archaeon]|nr:cobalamin-binding protein [Thermoplasmata archaeon]
MNDLIEDIRKALGVYDGEKCEELAKKALEIKINPIEVIGALRKDLEELGKKFSEGEVFLIDLMGAADAMNSALTVLKPAIEEMGGAEKRGKIVIATVEGDIHDIGKSIVGSMMVSAGFEVMDLGRDVPNEKIIETLKKEKPDLVGVSAMLTTTKEKQKELVELLKKEGLREGVKVMVGGAPVTEEWKSKIGADGYGEDAVDAVNVAKKLLSL